MTLFGTGTSLNSTRHVSIRAQAVVWLPEQVPVLLDCKDMAESAFGPDLNLSSIAWLRNDIRIVDNSTIRNIAMSPNNLQLLISALTIRSGAEDGTEGTFKCRACKNESSPGSSKNCQIFHTRLIAFSKYILRDCEMNTIVTMKRFLFHIVDSLCYPI